MAAYPAGLQLLNGIFLFHYISILFSPLLALDPCICAWRAVHRKGAYMPQCLSTAQKDSNRVGGPSQQPSVFSCQKCNTGWFRCHGEMVSKSVNPVLDPT